MRSRLTGELSKLLWVRFCVRCVLHWKIGAECFIFFMLSGLWEMLFLCSFRTPMVFLFLWIDNVFGIFIY